MYEWNLRRITIPYIELLFNKKIFKSLFFFPEKVTEPRIHPNKLFGRIRGFEKGNLPEYAT